MLELNAEASKLDTLHIFVIFYSHFLPLLKWQAFKVYLNEVYFGKTRPRQASMELFRSEPESESRPELRDRVAAGAKDIFRTYNCNLICNLSANSCHVIARKLSSLMQSLALHASVYLSLPPVLYYSLQYSTVQGCTAQYTLGEGRCCSDPDARTAPAQLTVSPWLSENS